jgi:hypothetical protein
MYVLSVSAAYLLCLLWSLSWWFNACLVSVCQLSFRIRLRFCRGNSYMSSIVFVRSCSSLLPEVLFVVAARWFVLIVVTLAPEYLV